MAEITTHSAKPKHILAKKIFFGLAAFSVLTGVVATCNSQFYNKPFLHLDINKNSVASNLQKELYISISAAMHADSAYNKRLIVSRDSAFTAGLLVFKSHLDSVAQGLKVSSVSISGKLAKPGADSTAKDLLSKTADQTGLIKSDKVTTPAASTGQRKTAAKTSLSGTDSETSDASDQGSFADLKVTAIGVNKPVADLVNNSIDGPAKLDLVKPNASLASAENNAKGDLRARLQDYSGAIAAYNLAIEQAPDSSKGYTKRANVKLSMNDYKGALQDFNKAISLNSQDGLAYKGRSIARLRLNDFSGALADYNKIVKTGDPETAKARGANNLHVKNYSRAVSDYTAAILLDPTDKDAYRRRAEAEYYLKNYAGAANDLTKAILIDPNYIEAYVNRGVIKSQLKQHDNAFIDFSLARNLGDKNAAVFIQKYCN